MEDNEEEGDDDDIYHMYPEYGDTATGEAEDEEAPSPERADDFRQAIFNAQREAETVKEKEKLERMLEDHTKKVVPKLRRWQHKARYHTGIAAMEGREWYT